MSLLIIALLVFIFCWLGFLVLARRYTADLVAAYSAYIRWISTSLDNMFLPLSEKICSGLVLLLTLLFAVGGFFLYGTMSDFEIRLALDRAVELNRAGKHSEAIDALRRIRSQKIALLYNELGAANLALKKHDLAEIQLKKAIALVPYYVNAHLNLAELYDSRGRTGDARFEYLRSGEAIKLANSGDELKNFSGNSSREYLYRIILALVFAVIAFLLPRWIIRYLQRRRVRRYEMQMADALRIATSSLQAGLNLVQAIEQMAREAPVPISQEFELVLREYRLGSSIEEALGHLEERMDTVDTRIFVNSIRILRRTGGNLVQFFDNIVQTINDRTRVLNKIKTLTAEGKAQAFVLAVIPFFLGFIMYKLNYENFRLLYTTLPGVLILVLMALCEIAGLYWMMKIIDIKV